MATIALPLGAAYEGATQDALDAEKKAAGEAYAPTVFNPATLSEKGYKTVGRGRVPTSPDGSEGFRLYYEVHGTGATKLVLVMGLNNTCFGWLPQVEAFARKGDYSVLVMDNRGVGNSETPGGLYKTSEMALDVLEVLEQLGWTSDVHLAGVSMGGMISLELCRIRPALFTSVSLISTAPGRRYRTPYAGLASLTRVLTGRVVGFDSDAYRINRLIQTLFPVPWLAEKNPRDPKSRTNQQVLFDMFVWRFRFTRRQTLHGAVAQMKAAVTHNVSDHALAQINTAIPKILILTGDTDHLVDPRNSDYLKAKMPNAELVKFQVAGHALGNQFAERVNELLERAIQQGTANANAKL